jgi:predicted transcriptional regulator
MAQVSAKDRALEVVKSLPEDASLDEAIERLCFIAKVEEGLAQSEVGEVTAHEEVRRELAS